MGNKAILRKFHNITELKGRIKCLFELPNSLIVAGSSNSLIKIFEPYNKDRKSVV